MKNTTVSEVFDSSAHPGFLFGGGEMGARMRELDWSRTAVGPATLWPQSLKTALSILLDSGYAMYIAWGSDFTQFYNDAYRPILGAKKHPAALGQGTSECFAEIWDFIGPMFRRVLDEGKNTTLIDQLLALDRYGYVEECYFTFSYSAIRDESGGVGGVLVTVIETTERVLEERRQQTLSELVSQALEAKTAQEVVQRAAQTLASNPHDVPFALLYLNETSGRANLRGAAGPGLGPASIEFADDLSVWPLGAAGRSGERLFHLRDVTARIGAVCGEAWLEPVTEAAILPIDDLGGSGGYLVSGLNPRHSLDTHYRSFLLAITEHVAAALAKVRAFEVERQRAESLAELDRAKTTFFSNVSHEFRTPLTLMLGPLEELLSMQADLPATARHLAEVMHRNGMRLQKLVNSLLDFSRIEAGRMQASYEAIELGGYTAEIASTFRSAMEKAGLTFAVDCPPLSELVFVDREMWEKIVLNLLSNALKYTFEGSIAIRLREADGKALLSVEDTGTGIPERELPKLFERFHRVNGARGRTQEGTGIGLALVAELIKLHGGSVGVESKFGVGSAFRVSLALGSAHLPAEHVRPRSDRLDPGLTSNAYVDQTFGAGDSGMELAAADSRSEVLHGHVLVADDNADLRDYVSRLLSPRYEVELASNGEEALARIGHRRPALVLSDVMMPRLDGFGLLRALRESPATSTLPVVLLSARAGEEARIEGLNAGANDYLVKPFTARELLARVESQIELARMRHEAAEARRLSEVAIKERLYQVLEQAPVAIVVFRGKDFVVELANPRYHALLPGREIVGRRFAEVVPELEQEVWDVFNRVMETGQPYTANEWRVSYDADQDGVVEDHWLNVVYNPLREVGGTIAGFIAVLSDVTAQVQSRREVERINKELEEFAYVASHDLQEPLRMVNVYTQLLIRRFLPDQPEAKDYAGFVQQGVVRMETLIRDLLTYSRIVQRDELPAGQADLSAALGEAIAVLQTRIDENGATIHAESLPPVRGDTKTLAHVFQNLLSNSLKYRKKELEPQISISAKRDGEDWLISVRDNGIGFDQQYAERIFGLFKRLHQSEYPGTGLGLAICQRIVERYGGRMWAESSLGEGATFFFTIPAVEEKTNRLTAE